MKRVSADHLRTLRNDLDMLVVISELRIPLRFRRTRVSFRCPLCREFQTTLCWRTNLARCFRCRKNFNVIDIARAERPSSFPETIRYLDSLLRFSQ